MGFSDYCSAGCDCESPCREAREARLRDDAIRRAYADTDGLPTAYDIAEDFDDWRARGLGMTTAELRARDAAAYGEFATGGNVRTFDTGATRDVDVDKPDYEAFLSPQALERFGAYMHANRRQSDGTLRAGDNWQKGIPLDAYMKSAWRHLVEAWTLHRGDDSNDQLEDALCAMLFNVQGYLHELLKARA